jgi:hypothetical protein
VLLENPVEIAAMIHLAVGQPLLKLAKYQLSENPLRYNKHDLGLMTAIGLGSKFYGV